MRDVLFFVKIENGNEIKTDDYKVIPLFCVGMKNINFKF
jgi:hypothetical protein